MQIVALILVLLSSAWLVFVAWLMWKRPADCLRWLSLMATTWQINVTELGLRGLAGVALVLRSDSSKAPDLFELGGWFILVSSMVLLLVPRRWHAAYAVWWSKKFSAKNVRLVSPLSGLFGLTLAYLAL